MSARALVATTALFVLSCGSNDPRPLPPLAAPPKPAAPANASANDAPAPPAAASATIPISSKSRDAVASFEKARAHADDGDAGAALVEVDKALALDPDFALAHALRSVLAIDARGDQSAKRAAELSQQLPGAERAAVEALLAVHRGDDEHAVEQWRRVTELAPGDWRGWLQLGARLYDQRKWDAAIEALDRAIALQPSAGPAYHLLGYTYALQGKQAEAMRALEKYAALDSRHARAHDALGDANLFANRPEQAEAAYKKATQLEPAYHPAWQGMAQSRFLRGDWQGGREALVRGRNATKGPHDQMQLDRHIAWSWLSEGKTAEAIRALTAIQKDAATRSVPFAEGLAALDLAFVAYEGGNARDAIKLVDAALARAGQTEMSAPRLTALRSWGLAIRLLAQVLLGRGPDAKKTLADLEQLARVDRGDAQLAGTVQMARGLTAWAGGDLKNAVQELGRCRDDDSLCRWQLALAQDKSADAAGAAVTRQRLLSVPRRDPVHLYVRARLAARPPAR
jgi:tetratricopeptide (TPR) repeat protein